MAELEEEEEQQPQQIIDLKQMPVMRDKPLQSDSEESDLEDTTAWQEMDPERLIKKLKIPQNLRRETLLATYEPISKSRRFTNSVY